MKMARQDEYKASLTREQFLFYEIRVVAKLRMQGETSDGSLKKVLEDNLFQFPTERMIASIFHTCQRRLDALESDKLVNEIAFGSAEDASSTNESQSEVKKRLEIAQLIIEFLEFMGVISRFTMRT